MTTYPVRKVLIATESSQRNQIISCRNRDNDIVQPATNLVFRSINYILSKVVPMAFLRQLLCTAYTYSTASDCDSAYSLDFIQWIETGKVKMFTKTDLTAVREHALNS